MVWGPKGGARDCWSAPPSSLTCRRTWWPGCPGWSWWGRGSCAWADVVAGVPRLELVGTGELRMEHHKGILAYGDREIHISGGSYVVKVTGEGLELRAMTGMELLITGRIAGVELT